MKVLFTLLASAFCTIASAQLLQHTTWILNNCPQPSITSMKFSVDSVFISGNNISYSPIARYWENGNVFKLYDFSPASTSCYDTGKYTFSVTNNILDFITVSDPCSVREPIFNQSYGSLLLTDIIEQDMKIACSVYPNPSQNGIFNFSFSSSDQISQILLYDIFGRELKLINRSQLSEMINNNGISISVSDFPSGLYLALIKSVSGQEVVKKLVKN